MKQRIEPSKVRGIWPPLLMPWDERYRLDERSFDANLDRLIAGQPGGLYTLDTASEFYTMEFDEWERVAQRFVRHCRQAKVSFPIGLGCTWTNQAGALRRISAARDLGVEVIHLAPPYWVPLNEDGLLRFMSAVDRQAGHLGVVIYAPPHGRLTLTAELYRRLVAEAPCIIGTKTMGTDEALISQLIDGVRHSHFANERNLVAAARAGASGCYSALSGVSLRYCNQWWAMIERGDWEQAQQRSEHVQRFYRDAVNPLYERGILAGAIDKAMAQVGGTLGGRTLRPPYPSTPEDLFEQMAAAARRHLPEAFDA